MNETPTMNDKQTESDAADVLGAAIEMTAAMAAEEDVLALMGKGLALCTRVLDCERGLLIAEESDGYRLLECTGSADTNTSYSTTAVRLVKEKGVPLLISDTIGSEELGTRESISRHDIRSVLCARLDVGLGEQVYLYLDSQTDRHPFSQADLQKFRTLSDLMANLVRKSDLLAERQATIEELRSQIEDKQFDDLVFASDTVRRCLEVVRQGAGTDVPVLLIGETGTGKEKLARLVHKLSRRAESPFVAVNCGAIPANLIESHLFGHEKGAFTGAVATRKGYFEEADGGTLFLDEVGELPLQAQAHFLRVLQEGEIMRVGSTKTISVDVRVVAATNVDLEKAVDEKAFRQDLYYRLNVLPIRVPPVRERGEDALLISRFFLKHYADLYGSGGVRLSREAEKSILACDWPGNVREIQNRIQRAVITSGGGTIGPEQLGLNDRTPTHTSLRDAREALDREMIAHALSRAPGNLTQAAQILDIDRKSLRILLEKYGIDPKAG
ncbi:MAG: AAA domain-containing protein [Chitinivibrionales bacterium]|nr:AAA domain-containing protein [Chitinivibrionales bacterium]MBD3359040.1 AAA domain-containing protein [Chitinivibrionales bacterium]